MKIKISTQLMIFLLAFAGFAVTAFGLPGTLDSNFGTGGIVVRNISTADDQILAVAIQPDNKIVAVGYSGGIAEFTVARFNTDGTPDATFGTNGVTLTSFTLPNSFVNDNSFAYAVAIQTDGKIVVGGDIGPGLAFGLVRYTATGQPDTTFGTGGKVITMDQNLAGIRGIAIQGDGKIIAAGYTGQISDFAVARYLSNGALDATFDGDGIVTTDIFADSDVINAVKLQSDGKILVAGSTVDFDLLTEFALARYNTDGSLDTGFNGTGINTVFTECNPDASGCGADALGIQPDGKIVVTGSYNDVYMARFNSDGSQINGITTTDIGGVVDRAFSLTINSTGGIFVAGSTETAGNEDFFVAKYNSNGTPDPTFDNDNGIVVESFGSNGDVARAVALQPNGGIIVGGSKGAFGSKEFAVARFLGLQPTAANATISGRILTAGGLPIGGVRVYLTDPYGNVTSTLSSSFGYYHFSNLPVGQVYILTPSSSKRTFTPSSLVVSLMDDYPNADFVSD
jgi:uncharacterized delta-60 repeat protein